MCKTSQKRRCVLKSWKMTHRTALILTLNFDRADETRTLEKQSSVHQKSIKTPHGNHERLSKTFLFIHQVEVSVGNTETVTCWVWHMTQDQINASACGVLLTTCVRWAACCVWAQRWSGRRGKGCWTPPGAAERSRWWTAADERAPPGWSWTPRPRTTSSPVATQCKHAQTSWLTRQEKKRKKKINPVTYFLPEVPRSSDNHCMGLKVLHIYIAGTAHQQLKR